MLFFVEGAEFGFVDDFAAYEEFEPVGGFIELLEASPILVMNLALEWVRCIQRFRSRWCNVSSPLSGE
jgi:hypothetical protein